METREEKKVKKEKKYTTISEVIKRAMNRTVLWVVVAVTFFSILTQWISIYEVGSVSLSSAINLASSRMSWAVRSYQNIVVGLSFDRALSDPSVSNEDKQKIIDEVASQYDLIRGRLINPDGTCDTDGIYRGDREYFRKAMNGEFTFDARITSKTDGQLNLIIASPVWKDGVKNNGVAGVVFFSVDPKVLNELLQDDTISENSISYILRDDGVVCASTEIEYVYNEHNTIELAKTDKSLAGVAAIEQKMIAGEKGAETVYYDHHLYYYSYAPLEELPGHSIAIRTPYRDFVDIWEIGASMLLVCIVAYIVIRVISRKVANSLAAPIRKVVGSIVYASESGESISEQKIRTDINGEEIIEAKAISNAMDNIMNRLETAYVDNRQYLDGAYLTDLVSHELLRYINGYYMDMFGVNVIISNSAGEVIVGKTKRGLVDPNALRDDESRAFIVITDRIIGSVIFKIPENCTLSREDAAKHAAYVAKVLEMVSSNIFRRGLQARNQLIKARSDIEKFVRFNEIMRENFESFIAKGDEALEHNSKNEMASALTDFITIGQTVLVDSYFVNKYADESGYKTQLDEEEYTVEALREELSLEIKKKGEDMFNRVNVFNLSSFKGKLYGDCKSMTKVACETLEILTEELESGAIEVYVDAKQSVYSHEVSIEIHGNKRLTNQERKKINEVLSGHAESISTARKASPFDMKIVGVAKMTYNLGGRAEAGQAADGSVWIKIVIPQLES